jgi:hypothetical protein
MEPLAGQTSAASAAQQPSSPKNIKPTHMTHYHCGITAAAAATAHDWVRCLGTTKEANLGGDRRTPQQGRRAET